MLYLSLHLLKLLHHYDAVLGTEHLRLHDLDIGDVASLKIAELESVNHMSVNEPDAMLY